MRILWWLAAPLAVTALAMLWALWAGRPRSGREDDEAKVERFGRALARPVPDRARQVVRQGAERPSGVAVRPSQRNRHGDAGSGRTRTGHAPTGSDHDQR